MLADIEDVVGDTGTISLSGAIKMVRRGERNGIISRPSSTHFTCDLTTRSTWV